MRSYRSLTPTDWALILLVPVAVVWWQLSANASVTAKAAGALPFGGFALGSGTYVFDRYRER